MSMVLVGAPSLPLPSSLLVPYETIAPELGSRPVPFPRSGVLIMEALLAANDAGESDALIGDYSATNRRRPAGVPIGRRRP